MTVSHTLCGACGSTLLICSRKECGKPFPRRRHEDSLSWGSRVYCGLDCAAADRQLVRFGDKVLAEKPCSREGCTQMAQQRNNESPGAFEKRKYCTPECGFLARRTGPNLKTEAKKVADREYQRRKREAQKAGTWKPTERVEPRADPAPAEDVKKPMIRPHKAVPVVPAPEVWRPAAWRAMDEAKRPRQDSNLHAPA